MPTKQVKVMYRTPRLIHIHWFICAFFKLRCFCSISCLTSGVSSPSYLLILSPREASSSVCYCTTLVVGMKQTLTMTRAERIIQTRPNMNPKRWKLYRAATINKVRPSASPIIEAGRLREQQLVQHFLQSDILSV